MNVTKIATIMRHRIHVLVTLASHLMMTSCTVMVMFKRWYANQTDIEIVYFRY